MIPALTLWLGVALAGAPAPEDADPLDALSSQAGTEEREYGLRGILGSPPTAGLGPWPAGGYLEGGPEEGPHWWDLVEIGDQEGSRPPGSRPRIQRVRLAAETVAAWVREHVTGEDWVGLDSSVLAEAGTLRVTQTPGIHGRVEEFLAALRRWRGRTFRVEVARVPAASLGELAESIGTPLESGRFEAALANAGPDVRYASFLLRDGQTTRRRFAGRVRATVAAYQVNQTGVLPVTNPYIQPEPLGQGFEVGVARAAPGPWLLVHLETSRVQEAGKAEWRSTPLGDLELLPLRRDSVDTTLLLRAGMGLVAGVAREAVSGTSDTSDEKAQPRGDAWLVRVREVTTKRAAAADDASLTMHRVHAGSWLLWPPSGALLPGESPQPGEESWVDPVPRITKGLRIALREQVGEAVDRAILTVHRDGIIVTATEAVHSALEAFLSKRFLERSGNLRVRVEAFEGAPRDVLGLETGPDGTLAQDWRATETAQRLRLLAHGEIVGIPDEHLRVRAYTASGHVFDCDWISGGCMGAPFACPAPVITSAGTGLFWNVHGSRTEETGRLNVEGSVSIPRSRRTGSATVRIPADLQRPVAEGSGKTGAGFVQGMRRLYQSWEVDRIKERRTEVETSCVLDSGQAVVLIRECTGQEAARVIVLTAEWAQPNSGERR